MKKKIMIFMLLLSFLVGVGVPDQAKAAAYPFPEVPLHYPFEYFIIVKSGDDFVLKGSPSLFYFDGDKVVNDYNEAFYLWRFGPNDSSWNEKSANVIHEYAKSTLDSVLYSNHNILDLNSNVIFEANYGPYTFDKWCSDAGLNCAASSNESSSVIPFFYEPDYYNYIVSKNLTASSTSGVYNLLMIQKSDGAHYPYHFKVSDIDYLGVAGAFADINMFTVRKFYYDPDGEGWKLIMQHDISELPFDHTDFTFDENTVFIYSDTDIYADRAASSVWQSASTEYYNVDIPEVEIPTITTIPSGGSGSNVGGQAKPGGMLDFIITFFTLVWTKLFAVEVPVDGYSISFQAIVIFGAIAGVLIWLGKSSFGKKG